MVKQLRPGLFKSLFLKIGEPPKRKGSFSSHHVSGASHAFFSNPLGSFKVFIIQQLLLNPPKNKQFVLPLKTRPGNPKGKSISESPCFKVNFCCSFQRMVNRKKKKQAARLASLLPKKEVDSKLRDALAEDGRFQVWILGDD